MIIIKHIILILKLKCQYKFTCVTKHGYILGFSWNWLTINLTFLGRCLSFFNMPILQLILIQKGMVSHCKFLLSQYKRNLEKSILITELYSIYKNQLLKHFCSSFEYEMYRTVKSMFFLLYYTAHFAIRQWFSFSMRK